MYRSLEYVIITSRMSLHHERRTVNVLGEQHKCLCHFKQRKKKKRNNPIPSPNHLAMSNCGALHCL